MKFKVIALSQLRPPSQPTRANIDDEKLHELEQLIRAAGVKSPLHVFPLGDETFEVIAGHRRYLAAQLAGLVSVPCLIDPDPNRKLETRVHENLGRVDLSPVEEAAFFAQLYEEHGQDTEKVAEICNRPRAHVERRLELLTGDKDVLAALEEDKISLGVAEELNLIERKPDRDYYLEYAVRGGCSVRQARDWRARANASAAAHQDVAAAAAPTPPTNGGAPAAPITGPRYAHMALHHELSSSTELRGCLFCGDERQEYQMYRKYVCSPCADRHLVPAELKVPSPRAREGRPNGE